MNQKKLGVTAASAAMIGTLVVSAMFSILFSASASAADEQSSGASSSTSSGASTDASTDNAVLFPDLISVDGKNTPVHPDIGNGKWTLVMLWAIDCHICHIDKPEIAKFHNKHKDGNITVFGISMDGHKNQAAVQAYLAENNISFPNSVGEIVTLSSSMYNIAEEPLRGTPTYLLFTPQGDISAVQAGHLKPEAVEKFIEANS